MSFLEEGMKSFGVTQGMISSLYGYEYDRSGGRINANLNQIDVNKILMRDISTSRASFKALFWIRPRSEKAGQTLETFLLKNRSLFVGLTVHPRYAGLKFSSEKYGSYLKLCRKLSLPMCIHTENDGFSNIEFVLEAALDYPDVNFVAVNMELGSDHQEAIRCIKECPNLYGDTSMMELDAIIDVVRACGSRKILFGSGAPFYGADSYNRYITAEKKMRQKFKDAGAQNFFHANAEKIFHLL
jgi:hypothetical protein